MISQAGKWTWTPSTMPLQPKTWNAHLWISFNFWWSARLVDGLEPHLPPLSSQKSEMLIFVLQSTADLGQTGQWTRTPSTTHLQPIKWNASFWITLNFWWLAGLVDGLKPHSPPLSSQKMKSSFLDYVQLLMISRAVQWTLTPSATPLQPIKWNAHFWILFNFWWSARLVDGLKPHLPPLSSQENEMLIFVLHSTSDVGQTGQWTQTPSTIPLQPKKWNAHFWITFNFWWLAGLVDGLKPHPPPVSSQKNEMLIFVLRWTSDDQPGWLMDWNSLCHHSPAKKMKCSFLDFVQLLMISQAGQWTQIPSATPLQPKNEMLIFGLRSTSDDWPGWSMDWNPICHPSPAKNMKCYFLDYIQLLMIGWTGQWTQTPSSTSLQPKKWNAHFCIMFNSNDRLGWSMDSNPIHQPSSAKKVKCSFLYYIQRLMLAILVNGLEHHSPLLSSQ